MTKTRTCSICNGPIGIEPGGWTGGHNAEPINNGRCCGSCNETVVIPVRIRRIQAGQNPREVRSAEIRRIRD